MRKLSAALLLLAFATLTGCTSAWINEPSPSTADLINDLKLEGFKCRAGFSSIVCRQTEAFVEKSAKVCTAQEGCVPQPCHDVRAVYEITQANDGVPGIAQSIERTVTRKIPTGDIYSEARIADLKDFCAVH